MAEFETGPALESYEVTCGCNTRGVRGPIYGDSVFVPRQRSYPAAFLAEVRTTLTGARYVRYLIIARQSLATPWEVVADPGGSGTRPLDQPKIGHGGFDDAGAPSPASRNLPREFASYWHIGPKKTMPPRTARLPRASGRRRPEQPTPRSRRLLELAERTPGVLQL